MLFQFLGKFFGCTSRDEVKKLMKDTFPTICFPSVPLNRIHQTLDRLVERGFTKEQIRFVKTGIWLGFIYVVSLHNILLCVWFTNFCSWTNWRVLVDLLEKRYSYLLPPGINFSVGFRIKEYWDISLSQRLLNILPEMHMLLK